MIEEKLLNVRVSDISKLIVKEPAVVRYDTTIKQMLETVIKDTRSRHAYIVDDNNKLIGSIRLNNIIQFLFPTTILMEDRESPRLCSFLDYSEASKVKEIMNNKPVFVYENTPLPKMVTLMRQELINELPVVDKQMHVIGEVNVLEIIAYSLS